MKKTNGYVRCINGDNSGGMLVSGAKYRIAYCVGGDWIQYNPRLGDDPQSRMKNSAGIKVILYPYKNSAGELVTFPYLWDEERFEELNGKAAKAWRNGDHTP